MDYYIKGVSIFVGVFGMVLQYGLYTNEESFPHLVQLIKSLIWVNNFQINVTLIGVSKVIFKLK